MAVAVGGDCLADIAVLREQPAVFGSVASDPTVSRLISTLADAPKALAAINGARAAARTAAWSHAGAHAPDHVIDAERPLIIDLDAARVRTLGGHGRNRPRQARCATRALLTSSKPDRRDKRTPTFGHVEPDATRPRR